MPTPTEMVELLTAALAKNAGVAEVVVDGVKVRYDRPTALTELAFWERRVARASGKRPVSGQIDLSKAW